MSNPSEKKPLSITVRRSRTTLRRRDYEASINKVKSNLMGPTLPGNYHIKKQMLLASAMDDFEEAEFLRSAAELAHYEAGILATNENDRELLRCLRGEFDQLAQIVQENTNISSEEESGHDSD